MCRKTLVPILFVMSGLGILPMAWSQDIRNEQKQSKNFLERLQEFGDSIFFFGSDKTQSSDLKEHPNHSPLGNKVHSRPPSHPNQSVDERSNRLRPGARNQSYPHRPKPRQEPSGLSEPKSVPGRLPVVKPIERTFTKSDFQSGERTLRQKLSAIRDAEYRRPSQSPPFQPSQNKAAPKAGNSLRVSALPNRQGVDPSAGSHLTETSIQAISKPGTIAPVRSRPDAPLHLSIPLPQEVSVEPKTNVRRNVLLSTTSPILTVETIGPRKIVLGKKAEFKITILNSGNVEADEVVLSIHLPAWVEVAGTEPTKGIAIPPRREGHPRPLQWRIKKLSAQSLETLVMHIISHQSRPMDLAVQWTFTPAGSQTKVEVQEPKLEIAISGPEGIRFGKTETYQLTLLNPGTGDAENVVVHILPHSRGQEKVASLKIGTIPAGGRVVEEVAVTARQSGPLTIRAQASADGGLQASTSAKVMIFKPGLKIAVLAPQARYAGTAANYRILVTNPGNYSARDVKVTVTLPSGAKYVSSTASDDKEDASEGKIKFDVGTLRPGAKQSFDVKCILNMPGTNRLKVQAKANDGLVDQLLATTQVETLADLKIEVIDPRGPIPVGQEMTYLVRIANRGTKAAENINVVTFFSAGIEPVSAEGAKHQISEGQVVFKTIEIIAADDEIVLEVKAVAQRSGSHIIRVEMICPALGTKLAVEETTRFYDESVLSTRLRDFSSAPATRKKEARRKTPLKPVPR